MEIFFESTLRMGMSNGISRSLFLKTGLTLGSTAFLSTAVSSADSDSLRSEVKAAIDHGIRYLQTKLENNCWNNHPGVTSLCLQSLFSCPRAYNEKDGPWMRGPIQYLLGTQQADGAFYDPKSRAPTKNYCTSLAILALASSKDPAYQSAIDKGRDFLIKIQADEGEGYEKEKDYFYGGIGYGGDMRPDLSNLNIALDALTAAGVPKNHPAYQKALVFLARCQDIEGNDQAWAKASGGFAYSPDLPTNDSLPNAKEADRNIVPYGSMTFAGLKSLIFCSVDKEDPRVKEALQWVLNHYSVEEHPGMGQISIFYYYYSMARALEVLGLKNLTLVDGRTISWTEELAKELLKRQHEDGHWVNPVPKYMEGDSVLVTAYALNALNIIYRSST